MSTDIDERLQWIVPAWGFILVMLSLLGIRALDRGLLPLLHFSKPRVPREPPLWGLSEFLLAAGFWFLLQLLMVPLYLSLERRLVEGAAIFFAYVFGMGVPCVFVIFLVRRLLGQPHATLGLVPTRLRNFVVAAAVYPLTVVPLGVLAYLWNALLTWLSGHEPAPQSEVARFEKLLEQGDIASMGFLVVTGVVAAPIVEEILFRGFLFGQLERWYGRAAGYIVSSLIFAGVHASLTALAPLLALGYLLAWLYRRTGSLLPAMAFHATFNAMSFSMIFIKNLLS